MGLFTARGAYRVVTMGEVLERCLQESELTMRSPRAYRAHCRMFSALWGHRLARDLSRSDVEGWMRLRQAQVKAATVIHELAFLSKSFRLALRDGLVHESPCQGVRSPRVQDCRDRILLLQEEPRLMAALRDDESRSLVRAAILTGMRRAELFGLVPQEVDLATGFIHLPASRCKNGHPRSIPLHPDLVEDLAHRSRGRFVWWPGARGVRTSVAAGWMLRVWHPALRAAGIEGLTFHGLRHTFASRLVMAGVGLVTVQTLMGHRDPRQTLRYAHLQPGHLQEAIRRLQAA